MAATLPATPYHAEETMQSMDSVARGGGPPQRQRRAPWADTIFAVMAHGAAWITLLLLAGIIASLVVGAWPAIYEYGLSFLWRS